MSICMDLIWFLYLAFRQQTSLKQNFFFCVYARKQIRRIQHDQWYHGHEISSCFRPCTQCEYWLHGRPLLDFRFILHTFTAIGCFCTGLVKNYFEFNGTQSAGGRSPVKINISGFPLYIHCNHIQILNTFLYCRFNLSYLFHLAKSELSIIITFFYILTHHCARNCFGTGPPIFFYVKSERPARLRCRMSIEKKKKNLNILKWWNEVCFDVICIL